jgi:hypothetical protein
MTVGTLFLIATLYCLLNATILLRARAPRAAWTPYVQGVLCIAFACGFASAANIDTNPQNPEADLLSFFLFVAIFAALLTIGVFRVRAARRKARQES